jgi:hypothetical protein
MTSTMSARIAAGVTATYVRDLSRHSTPTASRSTPPRDVTPSHHDGEPAGVREATVAWSETARATRRSRSAAVQRRRAVTRARHRGHVVGEFLAGS